MSGEESGQTYDLARQVAIITGGGRGLGRAYAQALTAEGVSVAVTDKTEHDLFETVDLLEQAGGTAIAFTADVTDEHRMVSVVAEVERRLGPVDILVNNAAVLTPLGYDWEVDAEEWWRTFEVNVRGPFLCTKAVLPGMISRHKGRIINISSIAAHTVHPYGTAYAASKATISHMTKQLAAAVKEYGITVFALSPSGPTAMVETLATSPVVSEQLRVSARETLHAGAGLSESIRMLMFMLSGQADRLTGRHLSWWDSPDDVLGRADKIVQADLYTMGLRV